ncbi:MAG TPA: S49 family peptidase, partial [Minicystis sp.]|nr:S49 family peptidase [Minicystis sp.]
MTRALPSKAVFAAAVGAAIASIATSAAALPPARPSDTVPDPGKAIASDDDASAIAVNPANVALMPGWELRWNTTWTGDASPLPERGHAFMGAIPLLMFGTGLRVDAFDPPAAAPAAFDDTYHWIRWALAVRAGKSLALGTSIGWGASNRPQLDGYVSLTSGLTLRLTPWLGLAAVARDWNAPVSRGGLRIERRYDVGFAVRPFSRDAVELGFESAIYENRDWAPRVTIGVAVPYVGRLRGELAVLDPEHDRAIAATAGLDVNLGRLQLSGGGVFGDAYTKSGAGFYAGAAIRSFREPGAVFPAHVARIRIASTSGVRGHTHLLERLWRLADDPETNAVLLVVRAEPASTLAHAEEVADAIDLLRARGKKVVCHLEDAGGKALYVCAHADRTVMNPAGGLRYAGVHAGYYYFGGILKKLGVRADFVRIGAHKLAAEQIASAGGSDVAQIDHQELVDEFAALYARDVGAAKHVPAAEITRRIAKGPFVADEARAAGLVDQLAYEDELDRVMTEVMGRRVAIVDDAPDPKPPARWAEQDKIGVVYLSGDMIDGESRFIPLVDIRLAGSTTIVRALRQMREDRSVKAVVFRVETGGGSSLAADVILREAMLLARQKPLIVSMGSHAASGGYYASVAAREIFANPMTVTGSIGIFYGKVDAAQLLDKVGVRMELFRSAPRADAESYFRPFTDDERRELGHKVKQFYDLFVGRVSEGRHMAPERVDAVARGKVWSGRQAL